MLQAIDEFAFEASAKGWSLTRSCGSGKPKKRQGIYTEDTESTEGTEKRGSGAAAAGVMTGEGNA
jgi:hypothetical protein